MIHSACLQNTAERNELGKKSRQHIIFSSFFLVLWHPAAADATVSSKELTYVKESKVSSKRERMEYYLTDSSTCLVNAHWKDIYNKILLAGKRRLGCLECSSCPPWMSVCSSLAFNTTDSLRTQSSSVENELMPLSRCRKKEKRQKYTHEQRSEVYRFATAAPQHTWSDPLALKQKSIYIRDARDERK